MVTTSPAVLATALLTGLLAAGLVVADARRREGPAPTLAGAGVLLVSVFGFLAASAALEIAVSLGEPRAVTLLPRRAFGLVTTGGLAVAAASVLGYGLLTRFRHGT